MIVGMPKLRRAGMMYFMAGCIFFAKRKTIPVCSKTLPKLAASKSRLIPRASNTSAEPDLEEMERLPCLAILIPPPASTKAAVVEILKLKDLSPPVPQLSIAVRIVVGICLAWPRIT